jgi:hypothetical protein
MVPENFEPEDKLVEFPASTSADRAAANPQRSATPVFGFEDTYVGGDATILFRVYDGNRPGVIYTSDPAAQTTVSAGVGQERNGVFFQ